MKRQDNIPLLTLELYQRGLATRKESKQVEKALKTDIKVQNRYKTLQEAEQKTLRLFSNELSRLNIQPTPGIPFIRRGKKVGIILAIAAVLICAFIPAFLYLKEKSANKENSIASGSNTQIETSGSSSIEDIEEIDELQSSVNEKKNNNKDVVKTAVKPETPPRVVSVTTTPEPDKNAHSRGENIEIQPPAPSGQESEIAIPPGLTFIFENMFANKQLTSVVIPERIKTIRINAFSGNPLISITIGSDVTIEDNAFPGDFAKAYNNNDKAAGTYTRPDINSDEWEKK
jgi:hypothetical protein